MSQLIIFSLMISKIYFALYDIISKYQLIVFDLFELFDERFKNNKDLIFRMFVQTFKTNFNQNTNKYGNQNSTLSP